MTPSQIAQARRKLGLTLEQFGAALGYGGSPQSMRTMAYRLERGERQLQPAQSLVLAAYLDGWRPVGWPHAIA